MGTAGLRVRRNLFNMRKWKKGKQYLTGISILMFFFLLLPKDILAAEINNGAVYPITTNQIQDWPQGPEVACETAVLIDADSGNVLYDKGKDELRYPASITKIMTALLAIENLSMDQQITFSETSVQAISVAGSSNMGMQAGEVISVKDCLYGLIIESANEAAVQLAEVVSGTESAFAEFMNQRAAQIGCKNTHFVNASGLPDENHYTTAYDMALIFREAIKNETFKEIIKTENYTIPATNINPNPKNLHTHHPLLASESPEHYEGCIGGKSGSTEAAGKTLVTGAERNGIIYIAVVMKGTDMGPNCADTTNLFNYGFNSFEKIELNEGYVLVPKGIKKEQLQSQEELQEDGKTRIIYSYAGQSVGSELKKMSAVEEKIEEVESQEEQKDNNLDAIKNVEQNDSNNILSMTSILLVCMAVLIIIMIILLFVLVRHDKNTKKIKKKRKKKIRK